MVVDAFVRVLGWELEIADKAHGKQTERHSNDNETLQALHDSTKCWMANKRLSHGDVYSSHFPSRFEPS